MSTPSLTDFLLARIAEDEADAESIKDFAGAEGYYGTKTLAECEAKRRIVDWAAPVTSSERVPTARRGVYDRVPVRYINEDAEDLLRLLALPYADHDDYDASWRP